MHDLATNRVWLYTWSHDSTLGSHWWLSLLDWKTGKPTAKIQDAHVFDFRPDRALYSATAPRDLHDYAKGKTVWVAKAWVGDWQTGKSWTVVDGLAECVDIAVRP